jgi:ABC-type amino acid transport substrate-binding protein
MQFLARLLLGAATLVLANEAAAGEELRTAAQLDSAPKYFAELPGGAGTIKGICVDLYRALEAAEPGLHIVGDQSWLPAVRIESGLATGQLDIACALIRSPERERKYLFLDPPLFEFQFHLVVRADDDVQIHDWDDVRDLDDDLILASHGWGYAERLKTVDGLHIDDSGPTPEVNLHKLVAGHGRFFFFRSPGLQAAIASAGVSNAVRVLPALMDRGDACLVLSRHLSAATVARVQRALLQVHDNGELAKVLLRYEAGPDVQAPSYAAPSMAQPK